MGRMITYACLFLFGLLALTHGQTLSFSESGYVNKSGTAILVCSLGTALADVVNIYRNVTLAFNCPGGCNSQGLSSEYSATQNDSAGTTTVTILNATYVRDGVQWTCRYGTSKSAYVTPNIISPPSSRRLIEESGYIILELTCIFPHNSLDLRFYLGDKNYTEGTLEKRDTTCASAHEASVNYTLRFPSVHVNSYNGTFNVFVNNGFYISRIIGLQPYSFSALPPPTTLPPTNNTTCELELGCGIGLGSGIPFVITIIIVLIYIYKGDTYAYQLGLLLGLGFGITFQVSWIIIVILISTGNKCKLELGLALGLGSGIPCVIACIVAVIFMFVEFKGIPSRVKIGKGILTGLLIASVIGIIVVYLFYAKLKADPTAEEPEEKPTEPNNKEPEEMPLGSTDKKKKTKHTGPPAIHIRTQNRVESEPTNKKTSDRPQPLPPVGVVTEDRSKHRPQPPPPENSDVKDPNKRGISANFDDKQGLPTEPLRSSRLPPLTLKQPTVEEEDASKEKPKKKRKNKKKGQMNEETQAEEMEKLQNKTTENQIDGD